MYIKIKNHIIDTDNYKHISTCSYNGGSVNYYIKFSGDSTPALDVYISDNREERDRYFNNVSKSLNCINIDEIDDYEEREEFEEDEG